MNFQIHKEFSHFSLDRQDRGLDILDSISIDSELSPKTDDKILMNHMKGLDDPFNFFNHDEANADINQLIEEDKQIEEIFYQNESKFSSSPKEMPESQVSKKNQMFDFLRKKRLMNPTTIAWDCSTENDSSIQSNSFPQKSKKINFGRKSANYQGEQCTHNRKGIDNIQRKVKVAFQNCGISFFAVAFSDFEREAGELEIRKLNKEQTTNVTLKAKMEEKKDEKAEESTPMSEQLNLKLTEYFSKKISTKYKKINKDQNMKNFEEFFKRCDDERLKSIIQNLTVETFYREVFIEGKNILGEKYTNKFEKVITLKKFIEKKRKSKKEGFEDEGYISKLKEYAEDKFISHYSKQKK